MLRLSLVLVLVGAVAVACGDSSEPTAAGGSDRLRVVASAYPVAELARAIGGDRVAVEELTPPGAEPHDVELTSEQADAVEDAAVVIVVGGGFQPAVEALAERRRDGVVSLVDHVDPLDAGDDHATGDGDDHGTEEGHDHADLDPHFWLDPSLMVDASKEVMAALVAADADGTETYLRNGAAHAASLAALDAEFEQGLDDCDRRDLVTAHAAFGYLARRYELTQRPVAGISPESEPDPRRIAELADLIRERGVTTVFTETLVSPAVAETLAREAGAATAVLDPLEGLTDARRRAGDDYLTVMRRNLGTLRSALGCR